LSASVAPEVNTIAAGGAPISAATSALAASTRARAARPGACIDEAFPGGASRQASITARTRGSSGVVAA
jgi:hypothetical protein